MLFAWLELAIANRYDPAVPALERFLTSAGAPQVRPAADRDARRGRAMGPADRGAHLSPGAAVYHPITTSATLDESKVLAAELFMSRLNRRLNALWLAECRGRGEREADVRSPRSL